MIHLILAPSSFYFPISICFATSQIQSQAAVWTPPSSLSRAPGLVVVVADAVTEMTTASEVEIGDQAHPALLCYGRPGQGVWESSEDGHANADIEGF